MSSDNNCLLVSTLDSKVRLFDRATGELLNEYVGHKNEAYRMDSLLINNDAYVVSGSEDGDIWIWDLVEVRHFYLPSYR